MVQWRAHKYIIISKYTHRDSMSYFIVYSRLHSISIFILTVLGWARMGVENTMALGHSHSIWKFFFLTKIWIINEMDSIIGVIKTAHATQWMEKMLFAFIRFFSTAARFPPLAGASWLANWVARQWMPVNV